ncbi:MAG TPA: glycosyltransferase family 1 protein [Ferruginibacter sp.]|nr:glycosyltransferase family 1 protein [Ferruginibacter sp.]
MPGKDVIKIFVDAHVFDDKFEGTRTFIKEIYTKLSAKADVHLFLGAYDTGNLENIFPAKGNITFVKYKTKSSLIRLLFDIPFIIKKYKIRYAHFQYVTPWIKNCRFIVTTHDLLFNDHPREFPFLYRYTRNFFFKKAALKADILTTVSAYSRNAISRYFHIKEEEIHIIPNAVSNLFFADYDKKNAKNYVKEKFSVEKIILLVSRIEPRKNHALLLRAFLELELYRRGFNLVFVGKESIKTPDLEKGIHDLPEEVKPFVHRFSEVDENDLLTFYRAAELFVYPSRAEGFGIPPLEAGAVKTPVLCSNSSAMSAFTFFGANHFNPDDFALLKKRMIHNVDNVPGKIEVENISETIKQNYDWAKSAAILYDLIKTDHT